MTKLIFLIKISFFILLLFEDIKSDSDQMKNVAKLRSKLLVEQKYDKLSKPVKNHTTRVLFYMLVHLFQIVDLSSTGELKTNLMIMSAWEDEHLTWNQSEYNDIDSIRFGHYEIWKPDLVIWNYDKGDPWSTFDDNDLIVESNGQVNWDALTHSITYCPLDLSEYPFDTQNCAIKIGPWMLNSKDMNLSSSNACQFPAHWTGLWFQKGVNTIQINQRNISEKGDCIDQTNYNYVLENRQEKCIRCLMVFELHPNVLQYRESLCQPYTTKSRKEFEKICQIPPEEPLFSLFRVNSQPITCPFTGNFEFTYSSSNSMECRNPKSMAQSCTDDSNLLFKFQACADVPGSESKVETLECLAQWKEGSYVYLVGKVSQDATKNTVTTSDQDKFRCFVLDLTNSNHSMALGQSNDASCEGLTSPNDGLLSLKLTRLDGNRASSTFFSNQFNSQPCNFPAELVGKRLLTTLDSTSIYEFANNFTMNIRNSRNKQQLISSYTCLTQKSAEQHQPNGNQFGNHHNQYTVDRVPSFNPKTSAWSIRAHAAPHSSGHLSNVQTRLSVGHMINSSFNASTNYLEYIIHSTKECSIGYACLRIYKRTSNVYEFWVGSTEKNPFDVCTYPSQSSIPTTLTTLQLEPQKCPFEGVFALSNLAKGSLINSNGLSIGLCSQSQLRVHCNENEHKLELQARCSFQDESIAFNCNGGWKDEQNHYLLLTSEDGVNKYCLTIPYQSANTGNQHAKLDSNAHSRHHLNQDHLFVSLNSISCHRNIQHHSKYAYFGQINHYRHSRGSINFELIRQSSCYSSLEISSSNSIQNNLTEKLAKLIFTILVTWIAIIK